MSARIPKYCYTYGHMERELTPKQSGGGWLYLTLGCGALALVGLCLVPPVVLFGGVLVGDEDFELLPEPDRDLRDNPPDPLVPAPVVPSVPPPPIAPAPTPTPNPSGPTLPPPPAVDSPRTVEARVTEVSGTPGAVQVGSTCSFPVTRHARPDGTFWCQAAVTCAGELLYGGGQAGFFDCTLYEQPQRHVVGEDPNPTARDGDAVMRLDTLRAELEVSDDVSGRLGEFSVRAEVTSVR